MLTQKMFTTYRGSRGTMSARKADSKGADLASHFQKVQDTPSILEEPPY